MTPVFSIQQYWVNHMLDNEPQYDTSEFRLEEEGNRNSWYQLENLKDFVHHKYTVLWIWLKRLMVIKIFPFLQLVFQEFSYLEILNNVLLIFKYAQTAF